MKNLIKLCFVLLISAISCKSDEKPENVLDQKKMITILLDIYEAETRLSDLKLNRDTTIQIFKEYETFIFNEHNIEKDVYKESLTYYYDHPDELEKIYETMLDTLALRESKAKAFEEKQRAVKDSLKKLNINKIKN